MLIYQGGPAEILLGSGASFFRFPLKRKKETPSSLGKLSADKQTNRQVDKQTSRQADK